MDNKKICPRCDRRIPEGKTYCVSCGFTVGVKCPYCSELLPLRTKKCSSCGRSLIEKTSPLAFLSGSLKKATDKARQTSTAILERTIKPIGKVISNIRVPRSEKNKDEHEITHHTSHTVKTKRERSVKFTPNFKKYLILLLLSLIFTQALRNEASHIFFLFMLFLPFALFIYTVTAKWALRVYMLSDSVTAEKYCPVKYEFSISNFSPLIYPFVDAVLTLPRTNSVRCAERTVRMSLTPLSKYRASNTVSFPYRGTYEIGVKCFYVYDFLRIMRIKVVAESINSIYILPRRLLGAGDRLDAISDNAMKTVRSSVTYDRLEVSDIRDYRMGDPLKSIHWKLSSKSEALIVKEYNTGTSDGTFIYCDMSEAYRMPTEEDSSPEKELSEPYFYEDMNEFLADGVVELTVAEVLSELRSGRVVTLFWYDKRSEAGAYAYTLRGEDSFESVYKLFATAPLCPADKLVSGLCAMAGETQNMRQIFITASTEREVLGSLCDASVANAGLSSAEVILYDPEQRYKNKLEHKMFIEGCRTHLAENGISLTVGRLPTPEATAAEEVRI